MRIELKSMIRRNRGVIVDHLILLILAFIPFYRMESTGILKKVHCDFPLFPIEDFQNSLFVWNHWFSVGHETILTFSIENLPIKLLWAGLTFLGMSPALAQRIYLILIFFLLGSGMYYLEKTVFPHKKQIGTRVACMTASIFFMINPFVIQRLYVALPSFLVSLSILPFTFALLYKGLKASEERRNWFKYSSLTALSTTILLTSHTTLAILVALLLVAYVIYRILFDILLRQPRPLVDHVKFLITTIATSLVLNLWWLIGLLGKYPQARALYAKTPSATASLEATRGLFAQAIEGPVLRVMRLQVLGASEHPWLQWIESPLIIAIGSTLLFFVILSLVFKPKNKHVIFFLLTTLVSAGFATGLNPPFEPVFLWFWNHVPLFTIFYAPDKFLQISVFGYSVVFGLSISEIYERLLNWKTNNMEHAPRCYRFLRKAIPKIFACTVIGLILLGSYPILSGNLYGLLDPVHVPDYYFEARDWLKQQEGDFRVMMMPQRSPTSVGGVQYDWSSQPNVIPIAKDVFPVPVIDCIGVDGGPVPEHSHLLDQWIYNSILINQTKHMGEMLSLCNVKYLVIRDNLIEKGGLRKVDTGQIKSVMETQEDFRLVRSFGKLYFFENKHFENNQVYGTTTYLILPPSISGVLQEWDIYKELIDTESFHPSAVALLSSQHLPEQKSVLNAAFNLTQYVYINWTMISDCSSTEGWWSWETSSLATDTTDFMEGNASIIAVSNAPSRWPPSVLDYGSCDPEPWDWTDGVFIRFWFKSNCLTAGYIFVLADQNGNSCGYEFDYLRENSWEQILIPQTNATVDLTRINKFSIQVREPTPAVNVTYSIDEIELGKMHVELPNLTSGKENVQVGYQRVNPAKYVVSVETSRPFILVFSESYDQGWQACLRTKESKLEHFPVNFYANGWYVNNTGQFEIILDYEPQRHTNYGLIATTMSVAILIAIPIVKKTKSVLSRR